MSDLSPNKSNRSPSSTSLLFTSYLSVFHRVMSACCVTDAEMQVIPTDAAAQMMVQDLLTCRSRRKSVYLIGNGGSAATAEHIAVDLVKRLQIRAFTLNSAALITCMANDYGYEHVFERSLDLIVKKGDILIAISSSGMSSSILRGSNAAKKRRGTVWTFSGFKPECDLRTLGDLNYYLPSCDYGHVEIGHALFLHCLIDALVSFDSAL